MSQHRWIFSLTLSVAISLSAPLLLRTLEFPSRSNLYTYVYGVSSDFRAVARLRSLYLRRVHFGFTDRCLRFTLIFTPLLALSSKNTGIQISTCHPYLPFCFFFKFSSKENKNDTTKTLIQRRCLKIALMKKICAHSRKKKNCFCEHTWCFWKYPIARCCLLSKRYHVLKKELCFYKSSHIILVAIGIKIAFFLVISTARKLRISLIILISVRPRR